MIGVIAKVLFPAWAGVIPTILVSAKPLPSFPRMGGGDPRRGGLGLRLGRLFPAWAGVILSIAARQYYVPAFPRMGGGDPDASVNVRLVGGFSPHGRG